ncbi:hypothetical protein HPB47_010926 [Ixodes persulcatus]|uniref:Uncharacterized protein n=1 Tax=Ixodes persulcatus TaxID=34615 RepID=A0AC60NXS3_IXOPE|nr:hypothetical protein HPB47_010926 [Ixodes persulcatus]
MSTSHPLKKLQAASRKSESRELQVWVQPITNHLYYCAALGGGNGPLLVSMWFSLLNHVVDKHDGHDGPFSECLHQPLSHRAWLTEGKFISRFLVKDTPPAILM